jgi:HAD superfamily hydrolase (TIGR01509 family)
MNAAEGTARRALLIDFGGTLFVPLEGKQWLTAAAAKVKTRLSASEHTRLAALLDTRFHYIRAPGSDLSAAAHERSMLPALESMVRDKTLATVLYDLQAADGFWRPRRGARELLQCAREQSLRVIVVSNIAWDIRPLFTVAGLRDHVHGFALSCEVGAEKPDKLIFDHALNLAGCTPPQALFIGDDPVNDSGALHLGIPVVLIPRATDNTDLSLFMIADWLNGADQTTRTMHQPGTDPKPILRTPPVVPE